MTATVPWRLLSRISQWFEINSAVGGLIWIILNSLWMLRAPESEEPDLLEIYVIENITLASLVVLLALLVQFPFGSSWIKLMWFCLGMSAVLNYVFMMYVNTRLLPGIAGGCVAGLLAALRTKADLIFLAGYFISGIITQAALMVALILISLFIAANS